MDLKIHPTLPRRRDFRIGCIGSGFIMNDCHLIAYRKAGFNPVAIASRTGKVYVADEGSDTIPLLFAMVLRLLPFARAFYGALAS